MIHEPGDPRDPTRDPTRDAPRDSSHEPSHETSHEPSRGHLPANLEPPTPEQEAQAEQVRGVIREEIAATPATAASRPADKKEVVLALEHVSLAFDRPVLEDVSFEALKGETVVVVGESGTGKSTILKLILRLLSPDKGRVIVKGQDIGTLTYEEALQLRQCMGMVFQGGALFDSLTVFDNVAYPLYEHTTLNDDEVEARVREKLQYVDLDPDQVMPLKPAALSGGMQKRVGVARGLAADPEIMLYDEPTSGLDPLTTATVTNLIIKLQRELGVTSIVVTHDIRSAFRMASKVALLNERTIAFFGTPEEMTASDDPYIQRFLGGY